MRHRWREADSKETGGDRTRALKSWRQRSLSAGDCKIGLKACVLSPASAASSQSRISNLPARTISARSVDWVVKRQYAPVRRTIFHSRSARIRPAPARITPSRLWIERQLGQREHNPVQLETLRGHPILAFIELGRGESVPGSHLGTGLHTVILLRRRRVARVTRADAPRRDRSQCGAGIPIPRFLVARRVARRAGSRIANEGSCSAAFTHRYCARRLSSPHARSWRLDTKRPTVSGS